MQGHIRRLTAGNDMGRRRDEETTWMWAGTVDLLDQAERLRRQFFRLAASAELAQPRRIVGRTDEQCRPRIACFGAAQQ